MTWEAIYNYLGIRDFIYFISSSSLQETLFPVKLVFITFAMFFLAVVIYFMFNSSWLHYKFLEDVSEFISWQAYGLKEISKRWQKIQKKAESGVEADLKIAIIEADDFLAETLDSRGYEGESFEELVQKAGKSMLPNIDEVLEVHEIRNSIVYNPDFALDSEKAKKILSVYEETIKNIGAS